MTQQQNNPLHGVKLEALLTQLVEHYGFEILAEQIKINCFKSNPSISSSLKFLRKTPWARDKLEAFYLYKYKQLPKPSDDEHELTPRKRTIDVQQQTGSPVVINSGEREFFDDPISGPKFDIKRHVNDKLSKFCRSDQSGVMFTHKPNIDSDVNSRANRDISKDNTAIPDPWAKWRQVSDD